jgi:hypothetical protein
MIIVIFKFFIQAPPAPPPPPPHSPPSATLIHVNVKEKINVPGVINLKMASVAVGISCTGPLGGKQGLFALS